MDKRNVIFFRTHLDEWALRESSDRILKASECVRRIFLIYRQSWVKFFEFFWNFSVICPKFWIISGHLSPNFQFFYSHLSSFFRNFFFIFGQALCHFFFEAMWTSEIWGRGSAATEPSKRASVLEDFFLELMNNL